MANAPTLGQRWMANALPLGHRKLANAPPYPGGTLGDSLDTSITWCGRTSWIFIPIFIKFVTLVFCFHEPIAFKLLGGTQDPLHTHPSFPSTTSRSPRRVISIILRLCSNVISSAWLDGTTLACTTLSEEVAKMETQGFSMYRNVSIDIKAGHS